MATLLLDIGPACTAHRSRRDRSVANPIAVESNPSAVAVGDA
jgi:hypothetical protein